MPSKNKCIALNPALLYVNIIKSPEGAAIVTCVKWWTEQW